MQLYVSGCHKLSNNKDAFYDISFCIPSIIITKSRINNRYEQSCIKPEGVQTNSFVKGEWKKIKISYF